MGTFDYTSLLFVLFLQSDELHQNMEYTSHIWYTPLMSVCELACVYTNGLSIYNWPVSAVSLRMQVSLARVLAEAGKRVEAQQALQRILTVASKVLEPSSEPARHARGVLQLLEQQGV